MTSQVYCLLDFETYSEAPLKKVGAFEYSVHPSTEVLCVAWRLGTRENLRLGRTKVWSPVEPGESVQSLLAAFRDPNVTLVAHNAQFERFITQNVLARALHTQTYLGTIPIERWRCTAAMAAALALPRNLEGAGKVLKLPIQKSMDGHRLMLKWCKPRKPTKKDASARQRDPEEFQRLVDYCRQDVDAEVELFLRLPMLTEKEQKVWCLDQAINSRGFAVDRPLVKTVLSMIADETTELNRETVEITSGELSSTNQRERVLDWLDNEGLYLPNLQKKTVDDALLEELAPKPKRILEIRRAISKTSTAKYQAFEQRSRHDDRLRDILMYHAASTGRWGGVGVQPQNFPKGTIKDTTTAVDVLASGDLELVRLIYGDPMEVFSSCLRGMIRAPEARVLDVADYNAIEARVLFWVAKHEAGLDAFRSSRDLYREMAASVYNATPDAVTSYQRFIGKTLVLGAGYGLGAKKFATYCLAQGQEVSEDLAETAIRSYRTVHAPVARLWKMLERAAIAATENPGKKYTINRTSWWVADNFLWCLLPSGRKLAYAEPAVTYELTTWGEKRPALSFWGVDGLSKKWTKQRSWGGVLTENVVQAVARDLMAEAMLRIEAAGPWEIVLTVHDELIAERHIDGPLAPLSPTNKDFCDLMSELPDWAVGLPVKSEGWNGIRYRKG